MLDPDIERLLEIIRGILDRQDSADKQ